MTSTRILEGLGRFYVALLLGFLYLPIVIMALMSFNASPFYQLPFEWTTTWYADLSRNTQLLNATWNSLDRSDRKRDFHPVGNRRLAGTVPL
jgi:spermidine/putrescine transport system permease protein